VSSPAREIIQAAGAGSLGTLTDEGSPFVSLVTVAATAPNTIVMLLSGLAKHTQNLDRRGDCSLLLVEPGGESGDPLAGARVTISGTAKRLDRATDQDARAIFLEKHPSASMYADFGDFAFFQIEIAEAHLVAGFGRIETIPAGNL
jgi:putative heme iron utilization protein